MLCVGYFYVNLTQALVICEEGTSIEERPQGSRLQTDMFVKHFLN